MMSKLRDIEDTYQVKAAFFRGKLEKFGGRKGVDRQGWEMKKIALVLSIFFLCSCNIDYDTDKLIGTSFVYIGECPNLYDYIDNENSCVKSNDKHAYSCKKISSHGKVFKKGRKMQGKISAGSFNA